MLESQRLLRIPLTGGAVSVHDDWAPSTRGFARAAIDTTALYFDVMARDGKEPTRLLVRVPK